MLTVTVPASSWHGLFADHHDTECAPSNTVTVETPHTHCDVFSPTTPNYLPVALLHHVQLIQVVCGTVQTEVVAPAGRCLAERLAARGPPAIS